MWLHYNTFAQKLLSHHIVVGRVPIFHCGEPSQTILVDINLKRVTGSHQNVDTKIKLETINQKWLHEAGRIKKNWTTMILYLSFCGYL